MSEGGRLRRCKPSAVSVLVSCEWARMLIFRYVSYSSAERYGGSQGGSRERDIAPSFLRSGGSRAEVVSE